MSAEDRERLGVNKGGSKGLSAAKAQANQQNAGCC